MGICMVLQYGVWCCGVVGAAKESIARRARSLVRARIQLYALARRSLK